MQTRPEKSFLCRKLTRTSPPLPPPRPQGLTTSVLPPPRPAGLGTPAPATRGIFGGQAADIKLPSLVGAPIPDIAPLSSPSATPQPTGLLGSPAQPPMPGILGRTL